MAQIVRALLAFFALGFVQALWLMAVALFMFIAMLAAEAWSGIRSMVAKVLPRRK